MIENYDTEIPNNEHYSLEEYEEMVEVYKISIDYAVVELKALHEKISKIKKYPKWILWLAGIKF